MTDAPRHTPSVACDEVGCVSTAAVVIGTGRRLLGWQRLDQVRLLCEAHAERVNRRLFELRLGQWLSADLTPFQRRWHRRAQLDDYIRGQAGRAR